MEKIEKLNQDFQTQVLTRLAVIESKIDDYKNLQQKCNEAYSVSINNRERINKIEDTLKWIWQRVFVSRTSQPDFKSSSFGNKLC